MAFGDHGATSAPLPFEHLLSGATGTNDGAVYRTLVEHLIEGVGIVDPDEVIRFANPAFSTITGYPNEQLVGMHLKTLIAHDRYREVPGETARRREGESSTYETDIIRADGARRTILVHATPYPGDDGEFAGTIGLVEDVTGQRRTSARLRASEERFRAFAERSHDIVAEFGPDWRVRYLSPAAERVLGYTLEEFDELLLEDFVFPDDLRAAREVAASDVADTVRYSSVTTRVRHKDGSTVWLEVSMSYIYTEAHELDAIIVSMRDITARMAASKEIEEQRARIEGLLKEKEILLREVHHRVKNDLGFVHSLLALQAARSRQPEVGRSLNDASQRVRSVAQVYEDLYRTDSMDNTDLLTIFDRLLQELRERALPENTELRTVGTSTFVSPRLAVTIATTVNELVTNAIKHAGEGNELSRITVSWSTPEPDRLEIRVRDDGPGFPPGAISGDDRGFGLTVVEALVAQWDGTLSLSNDDGAVVEISLSSHS